MGKIIILFTILAIIFIAGCVGDNTLLGSVVNTKEIKDVRLSNCLDSCDNMSPNEVNTCRDICYAEIADSFNGKTLCNNIIDKEVRTNCLIY